MSLARNYSDIHQGYNRAKLSDLMNEYLHQVGLMVFSKKLLVK